MAFSPVDFELARFAAALVGTAACTYYDLTHNRTVPDWLTFGLVGLGAIANVIAFTMFASAVPIQAVLFPAIIVLALGYLLYRMGQLGGADVLLYVAIALLVPVAPIGILMADSGARYFSVEFPFIVSIFLASGVIFGIVSFARYFPPAMGALARGEIRIGREKALMALAMLALGIAAVWMGISTEMPPVFLAAVAVSVLFAEFFYVFKEFVARRFLIRDVTVKEIDEEDVLAVEEMDARIVKKYCLQKLLTLKEIEKLKKVPLKKFPVYKNLPAFMPYILIAMGLSMLFGDLLALAIVH